MPNETLHVSVQPKDASGLYYPGEPVRFRFEKPPLTSDHRLETFDYRLATLQPLGHPEQFWLVWFVSLYEKSYDYSTRLLMDTEPETRIYWVGEGRCKCNYSVSGEATRMDLEVTATTIKNMETFFGEMSGEGRWLARLMKPGGLAGTVVESRPQEWLCYVRLN